jgi:hypothetical protein
MLQMLPLPARRLKQVVDVRRDMSLKIPYIHTRVPICRLLNGEVASVSRIKQAS